MSQEKKFIPSVTTEQIHKLRLRINKAIREYRDIVEYKEDYDIATEGLKYHSSNGQNIYLTVPKRSQRRKIQKEYLKGIQIYFNRKHKLHYTLKFASTIKSKKWIPILLGGLATTGGATGAAVYFALQGGEVVTENYNITLHLAGGSIAGHSGESFSVVPGTTLGELPKPTRGANEEFDAWTDAATNVTLDPSTPVEDNHEYTATYKDIPQVVTLSGGTVYLDDESGTGGSDEHPWILKNGQTSIPAADTKYTLTVEPAESTISCPNGVITWTTATPVNDYDVTIKAEDKNDSSITATAKMHLNIWAETPTPVEYVEIVGPEDNQMLATTNFEFSSILHPDVQGVTTTWSVDAWTGSNETKPTFGTAETSSVLQTYNGSGVVTIKATAQGKYSTLKVNVVAPYENSTDIWGLVGSGKTAQWRRLVGLEGTGEIEQYNVQGVKGQNISRGEFDMPLTIGDDVSYIPDNFLNNCLSFNSPITFTNKSKCAMIGNYFLAGNTALDPTQWRTLPFTSTITLPDSLISIGDDFLAYTAFNNTLTLPSKLQWIGDEFLFNAQAFNQSFTVPASITHVGNEFMQECISMVGTLTVNTDPNNFAWDGAVSLSFATTNPDAALYTTGITIASSTPAYITAMIGRFPAIPAEYGNYRNLHA